VRYAYKETQPNTTLKYKEVWGIYIFLSSSVECDSIFVVLERERERERDREKRERALFLISSL
jgi:hypothetical protein